MGECSQGPKKFTEQPGILDELRARNEWGAITLSRFLIGTLGNILSGFFGVKTGPKVVEGLKMATCDGGLEILFRWGTGLIVTLLIGGYLTGRFVQKLRDFLTKRLKCKIKELRERGGAENQIVKLQTSLRAFEDFPDQPEIPPRFTGFIEQLFFIVIVAFEVQGASIAMIGWATVKMATGWNWQPSSENRLAALSGLLGTVVSLGFALLGGLICSKKIWWCGEASTSYHRWTFVVALIFGLSCAANMWWQNKQEKARKGAGSGMNI